MSANVEMVARELRDMANGIDDVIDDAIGSRCGDGPLECFERVLRSLRSMRIVLHGEADKLDPEPEAAS